MPPSSVPNPQPRFDMARYDAYAREKLSILKVFKEMPGQVCLTLDLWTSSQGIRHVLVSGQFLDSDWKMHRKLLNVIREPKPDSDTVLSYSVAYCLSDWGLDGKLYSVTINEADLSDAAVANLRAYLFPANAIRVLVVKCLARSLSTIVKDALVSVQGIVNKVRDSVQYVKAASEDKFVELKQHLSIDNQTQWNTTYEMLLAAWKWKEVLSCLNAYDPNFQAASLEEWKQIEILCTYLKPLFDTANLLTTATAPPTTNMFFHEVWKIRLELARAAASEDPMVSNLTSSMLENFDKYWQSCCCILAAAVVMDPRFKMEFVKFCFFKIYTDEKSYNDEVGREYVMVVDAFIHDVFLDYLALTPEANVQSIKLEENQDGAYLMEFDDYMRLSEQPKQPKSELDQYLEEPLVPRVAEFDVVGWWEVNRSKYPTLSKMACDILSIPVCTVPVASVFDTVKEEMDSRRCALRPDALEVLMCAMDWLPI